MRVIKVFDNKDYKSLKKLKHELSIRQKVLANNNTTSIGTGIVKSYGAASHSNEVAFSDEEGGLYHYTQGYSMILYDYC